jgi:uncharacterized membrane protein
MNRKAAITVDRPREEVQRLWESPDLRPSFVSEGDVTVTFRDAPGDRGTEIHVELKKGAPGGKLGELVQGVAGAAPLAKIKDELRHFKQRVETGEVPRSDGSPEGEKAERKLKQRPAQPLGADDRAKVGV